MKPILKLFLCSSVLPLAGCTPFDGTATSAKNRVTLLSDHRVFSAAAVTVPPADPCIARDGDQVIDMCPPTATAPVPPVDQPVDTVCSNDGTQSSGGNVKSAKGIKVQFLGSNGQVACEIADDSIRTTLINERRLVVTDLADRCPALAAATGTYSLRLTSDQGGSFLTNEVPGSPSVTNMLGLLESFTGRDLATAYLNFYYGVPVPVAYARPGDDPVTSLAARPSSNRGPASVQTQNAKAAAPVATQVIKPAVLLSENPGGYGYTGAAGSCEFAASPLLVQLGEDPVELSPPLRGVLFDILGHRSAPSPHAKKRISWLTGRASVGNYFIVLPNAIGEVNGIDEMFGDNTTGPDQGSAGNGYEALAKWDGRRDDGTVDARARDGQITSSDAVFSRLRLWSDTNQDGIAQAAELRTFAEAGVVAIDLHYDASFRETDRFGNDIKMKSTVRTADGAAHVMYDIWFRIID